MLLVIRVRLPELVQYLYLFQSSLEPAQSQRQSTDLTQRSKTREDVHRLLAADDLDGHLLLPATGRSTPVHAVCFCALSIILQNSSPDDVGEHAFTQRGKDLVTPPIKELAEDDLVVTFWIGGCVESRSDKYGRGDGWLLYGVEISESAHEG